MSFRLSSKLTQISKPLQLSASCAKAPVYKRVSPATIVNDDKSLKHNKRAVASPLGNRMQSVLVGSGKRFYSTRADAWISDPNHGYRGSVKLTQEQVDNVDRQVEEFKNSKFHEVLDKTARKLPSNTVGASLTGDHVKPEIPGHNGKVLGYFLLGTNKAVLTTGIRLLVLKLLYSWSANARVMALASVEVDLAAIPQGKTITITFRGKPVFIKHRTPKEIAIIQADDANVAALRDPELDTDRFPLNNEWTVVLAICTHLGCVPVTDAGGWNAFFCPCHGSHYDASGRIRAGPAPLNLAIPPMKFTDHNTLILG